MGNRPRTGRGSGRGRGGRKAGRKRRKKEEGTRKVKKKEMEGKIVEGRKGRREGGGRGRKLFDWLVAWFLHHCSTDLGRPSAGPDIILF